MRKLTIKNVGPITNTAKIIFRRYCVIIGPQSSGKSTIAKLLSTCMWMEKEACTTLSQDVLPSGTDFKSFVEDFHRMHGYIHEESSEIKYESDFVSIKYVRGNYSLVLKPNTKYERIKISYIPSDRNVITMKDIEKRNMESTNFRSFLFDWLYCRKYFDADNKTEILELDVKYYFDKSENENKDRIVHQNGSTYNIPLYDASSGMQSAVPLVVSTRFFTGKYFDVYDKELSFEEQQKKNDLANKLVAQYIPVDGGKSLKDMFLSVIQNAEQGDKRQAELVETVMRHFLRLTKPKSIAFIVEEPEQNLFPQTQTELVNDIVDCCNQEGHPSMALITTHSPYVLASVNILMFAGQLVAQGCPIEKILDIVQTKSVITPNEVEVYAVKGGTCYSIKHPQTGLIYQNELDTASEYNSVVFDRLYSIYVKSLQQQ